MKEPTFFSYGETLHGLHLPCSLQCPFWLTGHNSLPKCCSILDQSGTLL
uniref:Uncharacterized protein n=1 Tax=Arundo donax TaxID=35708 RepID=A0A0A9CYW5_ARUDO